MLPLAPPFPDDKILPLSNNAKKIMLLQCAILIILLLPLAVSNADNTVGVVNIWLSLECPKI